MSSNRAPAVPLSLTDDRMCVGCGPRNPHGLHLVVALDRPHRRVTTRWTPAKHHQGYADIVHGGMLAVVLDELMGNLLWQLGEPALTAELTIRFLRPARVGHPLVCEASVQGAKGRLRRMAAVARTPAGQLVAEASARCVTPG